MSYLLVTLDEKLVGEFPLDKDKVTIGRKSDNDICLNNLAVSSYHSQIITVLDSSFLEDLNSTNGTHVNSRLVRKHALEDGDIIHIGSYLLKFINEEQERKAPINEDVLEQTVILSGDELERRSDVHTEPKPSTAPPAPAKPEEPPEPPTSVGKLQVLNGKSAGMVLDLEKSLTTFGAPKVAVAGVTKRANGYFLIHVQGSKNSATMLNGEVAPEKASLLEDHDIIEVAGIKLEFFTT